MRQTRTGRRAGSISLAVCLVLTFSAAPRVASQTWTTEPDFEIGAGLGPGGDGGFTRVGNVRVSRDGTQVHVVEPLASRITVWSPGGQLLLRLERDGRSAVWGRPYDVRLLPDSFRAAYDRHLVRFSYDGVVLEVQESSIAGAETVLADHSVLARDRLPPPASMLGWMEGEAVQEHAILRYAGTPEHRTADTVALLDVRRMALGIRFDDGSSPLPAAMFATQPLGIIKPT